MLHYQGRLCVLCVDGLRQWILTEAHNVYYSIHPEPLRCMVICRKSVGEVVWIRIFRICI